MKSKSISIIGLGLIGGSIAKALKASGKDFEISAFDKKSPVLKKALKEKTIDVILDDVNKTVSSDIIFLCLPADIALKVFEKLAPTLSGKSIITDVCGVKSIFEEKRNEIETEAHYIGGHPMAGREVGGYKNSDAHLFENTIYLVSSFAHNCKKINEFKEIVELLGAKPQFIHPELHDKVVARVSHLPQLLAISLVNSVGENKEGINFLDFAAGGFRDMTRIASSPFASWKSILKYNREEIITAIEMVSQNLTKLEDYLQCEDFENIDKLFKESRIKREKIAKNSKRFINPLFDIYFHLEDEPGSLTKVLKLFLENSLSLKDIEFLKDNEKLGGVFRISFETERIANKALKILKKAEYKIKE